ncbi:unnamed protein product [Spirodela intermedia]|uniref:Retrotransposon gag domain-containing protein n=1 Tax=Spirodela intermedia TaxID=51605 RepID=A0A7I8JY68_SPIIN|nr:unnamed protein product [Spirodela intermedia]
MLSIEGDALDWYMWMEDRFPFRDRYDFKIQLSGRFGSSAANNTYQKLLNLKQESSILEYRAEFERLSTYLLNIPTEILEHTYLKGLKLEIQSKLSMSKPIGLREIMDTSVQAEAHIRTLWQAWKQEQPRPPKHVIAACTPDQQRLPLISNFRNEQSNLEKT